MPFKESEPLRFRTATQFMVFTMIEEGQSDADIAAALSNPVSPLTKQEFEASTAAWPEKHKAWKADIAKKHGQHSRDVQDLEHCKGRAGTNIRNRAKGRKLADVESVVPPKKTKRANFEGRTDKLFERVKIQVKLF